MQGLGFHDFLEVKLRDNDVRQGVRLAAIFWVLWQARNDVVWRNGTWAALDLRRQVDGLCTLWQDLIKPIRASTRVDRIQWSPPSSGRLKCNVDAAIFGDRAGFGAVIRDHQGQYPNSDQFRRDAIAYFVSRPSEVPGLLSALCPSEDAAIPLFHMFREDPVISAMIRKVTAWGYLKGTMGMQQTLYHILQNALPEDWESVRTVLPEDLTPPGPEPFKKPPTGPSSSRGQDP
nr:uncharacterized protein LOC109168441 [Ipomoea batatas]